MTATFRDINGLTTNMYLFPGVAILIPLWAKSTRKRQIMWRYGPGAVRLIRSCAIAAAPDSTIVLFLFFLRRGGGHSDSTDTCYPSLSAGVGRR